MFNVKLLKQIVAVLAVFFLAASLHAQDTEEDIKEKANKLFDEEQYVEATSLYLRLISLNPQDFDYNYRYGTCLIFNADDKKKDALRYLSYAITSKSADPRAYYFRGRALHLNYQFKEAKKMYKAYKSKRSPKDKSFDVDREIAMCDNGKRLLSTFTDIIVSEKKQIDESKFFRLYHDMESIGGKILVTERFQSKMDKKMGHVPIVHFPKNATSVYYSSYGEKGTTGLDIYVRKKLPNGSWGAPYSLPGEVNTPYDDNFPYLHPSGQYLYFSSKGHNSMGGYDVFMARFDPVANAFMRTENVDFAICSPDDDLFYVVDSAYQNAYFASARQSEEGKLHVYRVRVARIPIQEVIIMGDFLSEINPQNKEMIVTVIAGATGNEIGTIKSNATGKYSHVFPQGGKYTYRIKIAGMDEVTEIDLELPFLDEFRPLKQKIIHIETPEGERVKIVNLFDERIEGGSELIGPILRKKAELNINVDTFDPAILAAFDLARKRDEILADLGFDGMSPHEVQNQLNELAIAERDQNANVKKMSDGIDQNIINASLDLNGLVTAQQELIRRAADSEDPVEKYEYLKEAKKIGSEISALTDQIAGLNKLKATIQSEFGDSKGGTEIADLGKEFDQAIKSGDEETAWDLLAIKQSEIFGIRNSSPKGMITDMIDESIDLRKRQGDLRDHNTQNTAKISQLEADIALLNGQLPGAKKKQRRELEDEIASKEEELSVTLEDEKFNKSDIATIDRKANVIDENIDVLQESITGSLVAVVSIEDVEAAVRAANDLENESTDKQIENEIEALENDYPEIASTDPTLNPTQESIQSQLEASHTESVSEIIADNNQTESGKLDRLIDNNQSTIDNSTNEIQVLQTKLEADPENMDLLEEQMALVQYRTKLETENEGFRDRVDEINTGNPPVALSKDDVLDNLMPGYQTEARIIKANTSLTEEEQLDQLQIKATNLGEIINDRLTEVRSQLESDPTNNDLLAELEILESVKSDNDQSIAGINSRLKELNSVSTFVSVSKTEVIEQINPGYQSRMEEIASNDELSQLDRLTQQQSTEVELLTTTRTAINDVDEQIVANQNDPTLIQRKNTLEEIATITESIIDERAQEINALTNVSSIVDVEEIKTDLRSTIVGTHDEAVNDLRQSGKSVGEISIGIWELERELLDRIKEEESAIQDKTNSNPNDPKTQAELKAIQELVEEQNDAIAAQRNQAFEDIKKGDDYTKIVSSVDKRYSIEMGILLQETPQNNDAIADREIELQKELEKELEKKQKALNRNYSIEVDLEWMILENELSESKKREDVARIGSEVVASQPDKQEFISEIRSNLLVSDASAIENTYLTKEDLKTQDQLLEKYENDLVSELLLLQTRQLENPSKELNEQAQWVEEELKTVRKKRGMISISLDEFETEVIATTSQQDDPTLNQLENERLVIVKQLTNTELSTAEKRSLNESLEGVETAQVERGNELKTASIIVGQKNQDQLTNSLLKNEGITRESPVIASAIDASVLERKAIDQIIEDASDAKSPQERQFLLEQAETRQNALVESLEDVIHTKELSDFEAKEGITISSKSDLLERKRRYTIEIGNYDIQIFQIDEQIKEAKRKEISELEEKREVLVLFRDRAEQQLKEVTKQLVDYPVKESLSIIASTGLQQTVSFNEEREIAASEEYAVYRVEGIKALELENLVRELEESLSIERAALVGIINSNNSQLTAEDRQSEIALRIERIKSMEVELERINTDLTTQSAVADKLLPANQEEAMKIQNLLARGVQPIKVATVALSIIQMPSSGLAINEAIPSIYSEENPIPVGVESPSGLTYRVQIGAFARAIPQDLFKEFNPVSGEKIGNTGITRYMAGFFNNSTAVVDARQQIRQLGYRDAFVVAYCDGERISFGEARRREAAGTCIPKGTNELMMEVAEKTADHLGIPLINEIKEVPEYTYNQAPGAVSADPIELKKGLFYTVQIGVFNRVVTDKRLNYLPEILTIRLPNGLIRYSTGMFDSASDCKSRKIKAYESGITDAFIVAYYEGVRIRVYEANSLLEKLGPSILQSNIDVSEPVVFVETQNDVIRTDTVVTSTVEAPIITAPTEQLKVQVVTKQTFTSFPRDILNRYNTEGNFYFDAKNGKVKSVIYDNTDMLPRLYKFEEDIDTVYLSNDELAIELSKQSIHINIPTTRVPGDLVDLILRLPYSKEFTKKGEGLLLIIEGIEPSEISAVQNQVKMIGLESIVLEAINEN